MICNDKDKTSIVKKNGVYCITCDDCDAIYIGQIGRNLKIRTHNKTQLNIKTTTYNGKPKHQYKKILLYYTT